MSLKDILTQDHFIQEGVNPAPGVIIMACTIGEDDENAKNQTIIKKKDLWLNFKTSGEVFFSIDAKPDGMAYLMGEHGSVVQFNWHMPQNLDELKASRKLIVNNSVFDIGPLRRIRIFGGEVICAGYGGQVYQLQGDKFKALPKLMINGEDLDIEDITGTSPNDLVAVTSDGHGARFNGTEWQILDLPTNVLLSGICSMSDGRYAITGNNGTIIVGKQDQWDLISPIDSSRSYYYIAALNRVIYVAYLGGIDVIRGERIEPFDIPDADKLEFTMLTSGPDGIWSFAGHTVGLITETGWQTIARR